MSMLHPGPDDPMPEPLLTAAEMVAVDRAAVAVGVAVDSLMEAAGRAVAHACMDGLTLDTRIAVLCGAGNNGGDGYVAARCLAERGFEVCVFRDAEPPAGSPAGRAREGWRGDRETLDAFQPGHWSLVVDALFGAGLTRPLSGGAARAVARLAANPVQTLAVDVPSGLNADTGAADGVVVAAQRTVTFFRLKPGHLLWPGRGLCGSVFVADIGLTDEHLAAAAAPGAFRNTPPLWLRHRRSPALDAHKYARGHVLVISGPELNTGAARLAAYGALNAGAGAVTIAGAREALLIHAAHVSAVMLAEAATPEALCGLLEARRFDAAVCGPAAGIGPLTLERVDRLIEAGLPLVLDADALTSLAGQLPRLSGRAAGQPAVLTPHAGEFARLFGSVLEQDAALAALPPAARASKLEQARAAARIARAVVVFKGVDTVIAAPDGRAAINDVGGPELATAGSGDVLAGLIAAHLGQGMPAFEAAAAAVWLHGVAGASYGAGLTAERLVDAMRPVDVWRDALQAAARPASLQSGAAGAQVRQQPPWRTGAGDRDEPA